MDQNPVSPRLARYLDRDGRLCILPKKGPRRFEALVWLAGFFEDGVRYTEQQVNGLLNEKHTFADPAFLRRELVDHGLVRRQRDGTSYWKTQEEDHHAQ